MHINNTSPEFCIIAPTSYLEEFADYSNSHLILAHLVDTDEQYRQYYANIDQPNCLKIMDNGAFELGESYEPDKLIELATSVGADVIVLPDYPGKPSEVTIMAAKNWIPRFKEAGFKTMFVPQSSKGDLEDYINCYSWAAAQDDIDIIGMSILGMPNALPHIAKPLARVVLSNILLDRQIFNHNKHHHYLGLINPSIEIPSLLSMGVLDTMDSSNPVWAGIHGHIYNPQSDSYLSITKDYLPPVDFDYNNDHNTYTHTAIDFNLNIILSLFDDLSDIEE